MSASTLTIGAIVILVSLYGLGMARKDGPEEMPRLMQQMFFGPIIPLVSIGASAIGAFFLSAAIAHWIGIESWGEESMTRRGTSGATIMKFLAPPVAVTAIALVTILPSAVLRGLHQGRWALLGYLWSAANLALVVALTLAALQVIKISGIESSQSLTPIILACIGFTLVLSLLGGLFFQIFRGLRLI